MKKQPTAAIEREEDGYVSLCPELDIASQEEVYVTRMEVSVGWAPCPLREEVACEILAVR